VSDAVNLFKRLLGVTASRPSIGTGTRVFAVGDIHGRLDLLDILLKKIALIAKGRAEFRNTLVFLGDYVDRGSDSRGVIERLIHLDLPGWKTVFLRGNHDQAILDFVNDAGFYRTWRSFGAPETLLSYGVRPPRFDNDAEFARARDEFAASCPQEHLDFIDNLPYKHVEGDYFFVHAGVRPGLALEEQTSTDMLWIRDEFLQHNRPFAKVIVHGHSPTSKPVMLPNRIGVDTGAHATDCLTAAIFEGESCIFLDTKGNVTAADGSRPLELARA